MEKGLPLTETGTAVDLLAVLCQPGFSSKVTATEISGRGVGMDVVQAQVRQLGGRLSLETQVGQGTCFKLEIPAPQMLVPCVLVLVGAQVVALPSEEIRSTALVETLRLQPVNQAGFTHQVQTQGQPRPAIHLRQYWQGETVGELPETAIGLFLGDAWLLADDLISQGEQVISALPSPLISPIGLLGFSLQAMTLRGVSQGRLIPVLDPGALVQGIRSGVHFTPLSSATPPLAAREETGSPVRIPKILVVDDAALVRRRIEISLVANGYQVVTCADGLEAWQWLTAGQAPLAMITDIEMPGLDGFTLIDRCRQAKMNFPILVISSRLSEDWGQEARRMGATEFLTKGFSTPELIAQLQKVIGS